MLQAMVFLTNIPLVFDFVWNTICDRMNVHNMYKNVMRDLREVPDILRFGVDKLQDGIHNNVRLNQL